VDYCDSCRDDEAYRGFDDVHVKRGRVLGAKREFRILNLAGVLSLDPAAFRNGKICTFPLIEVSFGQYQDI